jgi:hypothetical protein
MHKVTMRLPIQHVIRWIMVPWRCFNNQSCSLIWSIKFTKEFYFQKCKDLDPMVYMWKGLVCNINSVCNIHFDNHLDLARTHLLGVAWNKTKGRKMYIRKSTLPKCMGLQKMVHVTLIKEPSLELNSWSLMWCAYL